MCLASLDRIAYGFREHAINLENQRRAGGRTRDHLLRRVARPGPRPGARHQAAAAAAARAAAAGRHAEQGIRWDPLAGEWVVIAAARQDRTFLPPADQCPLDPSAPGRLDRDPGVQLRRGGVREQVPVAARAARAAARWSASPPTHDASFAQLTPARVRTVFEAWVDRTQALSALPETEQVYCFENRGEEIGVTLQPPARADLRVPVRHPAHWSGWWRRPAGTPAGNLFDDLVAAELRAGSRIVTRNEHWIAFVPAAARWPYEVRIFPAARVPDLPVAERGGAGGVRAAVPGRAAPVRRAVRRAGPVHRRVAPGARSGTRRHASSSPRTFRYCRSGGRPAS